MRIDLRGMTPASGGLRSALAILYARACHGARLGDEDISGLDGKGDLAGQIDRFFDRRVTDQVVEFDLDAPVARSGFHDAREWEALAVAYGWARYSWDSVELGDEDSLRASDQSIRDIVDAMAEDFGIEDNATNMISTPKGFDVSAIENAPRPG